MSVHVFSSSMFDLWHSFASSFIDILLVSDLKQYISYCHNTDSDISLIFSAYLKHHYSNISCLSNLRNITINIHEISDNSIIFTQYVNLSLIYISWLNLNSIMTEFHVMNNLFSNMILNMNVMCSLQMIIKLFKMIKADKLLIADDSISFQSFSALENLISSSISVYNATSHCYFKCLIRISVWMTISYIIFLSHEQVIFISHCLYSQFSQQRLFFESIS